jgi:hypothetical protein
MTKYRFVCTCGRFEFEDESLAKVLEAAKKHAETCSDISGADDIALGAMVERIE